MNETDRLRDIGFAITSGGLTKSDLLKGGIGSGRYRRGSRPSRRRRRRRRLRRALIGAGIGVAAIGTTAAIAYKLGGVGRLPDSTLHVPSPPREEREEDLVELERIRRQQIEIETKKRLVAALARKKRTGYGRGKRGRKPTQREVDKPVVRRLVAEEGERERRVKRYAARVEEGKPLPKKPYRSKKYGTEKAFRITTKQLEELKSKSVAAYHTENTKLKTMLRRKDSGARRQQGVVERARAEAIKWTMIDEDPNVEIIESGRGGLPLEEVKRRQRGRSPRYSGRRTYSGEDYRGVEPD